MRKFVIFYLSIILFMHVGVVTAQENLTRIMGEGQVSAEAMYLYLIKNNKSDGLNPIDEDYAKEFVITTIKEADMEGVRSDVAFALMMHETGFLNFGGDVLPVQNNFGGLGATGGGAQGAKFSDMQTGIRGVVQHLKCYASDDALVNDVVDTRFADYLREKAVYVEWLGKADNPGGYGWAVPGNGYGYKIVSMIDEMQKLDVSEVSTITVYEENVSDEIQENELHENTVLNDILVKVKGDSLNIAVAAVLMFTFTSLMKRYVSAEK
ncbi:MAG: hypothetical protein E7218_05795 [Anaerofustis stercorihominis]|nr:hypothetical protein [Anaerofustis stercorihominis]